MKNIVIVGGGIAGLSALNGLIDLGISATLIESGSYPSHKLCGEFLSPESIPLLTKWDVMPPTRIEKISIISDKDSFQFSLPLPACSESRFEFDIKLVNRAIKKGARILMNAKVVNIEKDNILLDNGERLPYTDLIMSTGRLFGTTSPMYYGFKGHFEGIDLQKELEMYPFKGGYGGISSIGKGQVNVACLIAKTHNILNDPLKSLFLLAPALKKRLEKGSLILTDWIIGQIPKFGIKNPPAWKNTYFIGDAAGTIPPATGLGLSLALNSGYMAAEFAKNGDYQGFKWNWTKRYAYVFKYGQALHYCFTHPTASRSILQLTKIFPQLPPKLFAWTRLSS